MIQINELSFGYHKHTPILENICFDIEKHQCIAVLGNNGAGKSTLLKCINGIMRPQQGTVLVQGKDVLSMHRKEMAKNLAYVAQKNEATKMTVFDTVLLGRRPYIKWEAAKEDYELVEKMIDQMGLNELKLCYIDEISGGELQKVMISRALVQQPKLLLLDEPTSNLDPKNQYEVMAMVQRIAKEQQIAVVVVIHDLNLALRYCDRFLLLKDQKIYAYGGHEIMQEDTISEIYRIPVKVEQYLGVRVVIPIPEGEQVCFV